MKNVISLSCFRHRASSNAQLYKGLFYPHHLPGLLRAYLNLFPDWEIRVHHDWTVNRGRHAATLHALQALYPERVKLVWMRDTTLCCSMLWRLQAINDPEVDAFLCRDLESLPTPREAQLVRDWLDSGKACHAIHDAGPHGGPLMGGMVGFRAPQCREMWGGEIGVPVQQHHASGIDMNVYGADQDWQNNNLWPNFRRSALLHKRDFCATRENEAGVERRDALVGCQPSTIPKLAAHWGERTPVLTVGANDLSQHIGLVFDSPRATAWWDENGLPEVQEMFENVGRYLGGREEFAAEVENMPAERHLVDQWMRDSWQRVQSKEMDGPRVILCSNDSTNYCFFLPIAAAFWREICGRRASVVLIAGSTQEEWRNGYRLETYNALRALGADIHFAIAPAEYGITTSAQVARLCAGALPCADHARIITTDADMLPLRPEFWDRPCEPGKLNLYCANAYGGANINPICYIEATGATWREIVPMVGKMDGFGWEDELLRHMSGSVEAVCRAGLSPEDKGNFWSYDERFFGKLMTSWSGWGDRVVRINRPPGEPPRDRLDRANYPGGWPRCDNDGLAPYTDCHLFRPGWSDANWPVLRTIIQFRIPWMLDFFDRFRAEYVARMG